MEEVKDFYKKGEKGWNKQNYINYCEIKYEFIRPYLRGKILDAGCGTGWFYKKYKYKKNVTNVDFIKRKIPKFKKSKLTRLPFKKNKFYSVICLDVIEHLPYGEDVKAIKELFRVGKRVMISTSIGNPFFSFFTNIFRLFFGVHNFIMQGHYREYTEKELEKILNKKGKIIASKRITMPFPGILQIFSWILRLTGLYYTKLYVVDSK